MRFHEAAEAEKKLNGNKKIIFVYLIKRRIKILSCLCCVSKEEEKNQTKNKQNGRSEAKIGNSSSMCVWQKSSRTPAKNRLFKKNPGAEKKKKQSKAISCFHYSGFF